MSQRSSRGEGHIHLTAGEVTLDGNLLIPRGAPGLVVFAHGSGSSRLSPRNQYVAKALRDSGMATLLFDLLTLDEEAEDRISGRQRFDIRLLADRLIIVTDWLQSHAQTRRLKLGYFGASTGAAAALVAAAERPNAITAVVSRGGRPDLAEPALAKVKAPTLLIVGEHDVVVIGMNRSALVKLQTEKRLVIVPGATHLFEELGALEQVAELSAAWFLSHFSPRAATLSQNRITGRRNSTG